MKLSFRDSLLEAEDVDSMMKLLEKQKNYRRYLIQIEERSTRTIQQSEALRYQMAKRSYRFSIHPVVVAVSYLTLQQAEAHNLISIIEGIRYSIPVGEMRELLTI